MLGDNFLGVRLVNDLAHFDAVLCILVRSRPVAREGLNFACLFLGMECLVSVVSEFTAGWSRASVAESLVMARFS